MEREFKIGDRVKCWYHDKWWPGTIVDFPKKQIRVSRIVFDRLTEGLNVKIIEEDEKSITYEHPTQRVMLVKTDEKIGDESDMLLEGYGLRGPIDSPFTIFENDPEPDTSDFIFRNR